MWKIFIYYFMDAGHTRKLFLMIVGTLLLVQPSVLADSQVPPRSYTVLSPNGQYVFVMIAPLPPEQDAANYREPYASRIREIRQTYSVSGLYPNDGSTTPLWTVDWYAWHVEISSDGVHLLRLNSVATSPDDEAIAFFANGRLLNSYRIRDLVDLPWLLPRSVSHIRWTSDELLKFDDTAMTYTIHTTHGEELVFDLTTGTIIDAWHPVRWFAFGGLTIGLVILIMWGFRNMVRNS